MPQRILLNGPQGKVDAIYHSGVDDTVPCVLILPPHTSSGVDMLSPFMVELFNMYMAEGFATLKFNFRKNVQSKTTYAYIDNASQEVLDATFALDWLSNRNIRSRQCWIVGFSFGAYIAMQALMRRPEIFSFVAIAPPVDIYDFSFLSPCPSPGLFVTGSQDIIAKKDSVERFIKNLKVNSKNKYLENRNIELKIIDGADHFFNKKIKNLMNVLSIYTRERISEVHNFMDNKQENRHKILSHTNGDFDV